MVIALSIVHGLVLFGFFIAMAVSWFGSSADIKDCSRFAGIVVGALVLATLPILVLSGALAVVLAAFGLVIGLARTFLFTAVGASCCAGAGFAAFPLIKPGLGGLDGHAARVPLGPTLVVALVVAGAWCAYTFVLFSVFTPELSDIAQRLIGEAENLDGSESAAIAAIGVCVIAFEEELVYRLGIQNLVARYFGWWDRRYWLAILISATIWTIGHVGTLEPGWVKLAQIFPAGIALGWLARKHGIEACIVAHAVFNIAAYWMGENGVLPV
ncbi:MAG: CPBP family intramembrane metalloprotease [Gammaproteobacteria bacterium]|nr:CPBP family intramembrane metalloprotease [Gammaproteobacteria bacterium]